MQKLNGNFEILKFVVTFFLGIAIAITGYLITNKLEGIERTLNEMNGKINTQMVINKETEKDVERIFETLEDHEGRIGKLENDQ
ncbi:MAG: hypothetical protein U5K00_02140 [Melioribacteraceae bacterium]|nr:hypothetical protein [Melioribacteraceae bacterium]